MKNMLPNKPYLLRASYQWIVDSQCTALIVTSVRSPRCKVPTQYVANGEIILNIAPEAVRELKIGADLVEFQASFSGVVYIISVPIRSITAIYAEENGEGMFFEEEEDILPPVLVPLAEPISAVSESRANVKRAHLTLVE